MNIIEEHQLLNYNRESTYNITLQELELIRKELVYLTEIDLNSSYGFGTDKPTDLPLNKVQYTTSFKTDSTLIYYPDENELPAKLDLFLTTINQIISDTDTLKN